MSETIRTLSLIMVCAPLLGSILAGLFSKILGRKGSHRATIGLMLVSLGCAIAIWILVIFHGGSYVGTIYVWGLSGRYHFDIGFMIDNLTAWLMIVVTFVSTLVHIYSIGYMADDDGYTRFFCYMSLFTFAMLMLITANNFLQLYFGWEGVGLVSYLLIGFWYQKETAVFGSLKAFLVNRVGDFGFIIGIAAVLTYFNTIDYQTVFANAQRLFDANTTISVFPGTHWSVLTVICITLFIGAMGKSAQMPLHVWLPESMEGPTPISALIHAATMVTAGIFMLARMSPLFELSQTALTLVLVIGATGALFTGMVGVVQHDIKRVIAYSTLSQLGYMTAACGASAFAAGIFHLMTHACFKALLFLAAGSVITAMHHEQDLRKMGGLYKYMPITYITFLVGALALSAIPPFAGFYSKDAIIEAVHNSTIPGHTYSYYCVLFGSFVTALYIFRAFFLAFHGKERIPADTKKHLRESPWVMWVPLIALAIPSTVIGALLAYPLLYKANSLFGNSIFVLPKYDVLKGMAANYHGWFSYALHAFITWPFWFAVSGIFTAWFCCWYMPNIREVITRRIAWFYYILVKKYGFDDFNQIVFAHGGRRLGQFFYYVTDAKFIDDYLVNGSGRAIQWGARMVRRIQSGYLYHYAFAMIIGLLVFLGWLEITDTHIGLFKLLTSNYFTVE